MADKMTSEQNSTRPNPVVLCILDGWGERQSKENNAVAQANTPHWDRLSASSPKANLQASETFVGLPSGQMGNSEVGHMNLGAGRVVMQDLPRIDAALASGEFKKNERLVQFISAMKASGGAVHMMGLLSPGGVHSHQDHMALMANHFIEEGLNVKLHAILDGRDTPPKSALGYLDKFVEMSPKTSIATIAGRFYAMDRDNNWDRVSGAVDAMTNGNVVKVDSAKEAIEVCYGQDKLDEFIDPTVIAEYDGMKDGDGLFMANFRADRAREILTALLDPSFTGFERSRSINFADALGMVEYSKTHNELLGTVFPSEELSNVLGAVISQHGLKQLRIAETEKYPHVTFFFNGGEEAVYEGEERILIPSPKVKTYDLQPEMSAPEVTNNLVEAIENRRFDLIVVNFANTDMVGHTGNLAAATKAVEAVDGCLGRLADALVSVGGVMLVTADHGNAEMMVDQSTGQAHTAHTLNPVPLLLVNAKSNVTGISSGRLADVAPTILDLMQIPQPVEMTGNSLLHHAHQSAAE